MIRKSYIREKQADRMKFLKKAYELTEGNPNEHVSLQTMKKDIGAWSIEIFREYATYWIDKGCLHGIGKAKKINLIRMTADGIEVAEKDLLSYGGIAE